MAGVLKPEKSLDLFSINSLTSLQYIFSTAEFCDTYISENTKIKLKLGLLKNYTAKYKRILRNIYRICIMSPLKT